MKFCFIDVVSIWLIPSRMKRKWDNGWSRKVHHTRLTSSFEYNSKMCGMKMNKLIILSIRPRRDQLLPIIWFLTIIQNQRSYEKSLQNQDFPNSIIDHLHNICVSHHHDYLTNLFHSWTNQFLSKSGNATLSFLLKDEYLWTLPRSNSWLLLRYLHLMYMQNIS